MCIQRGVNTGLHYSLLPPLIRYTSLHAYRGWNFSNGAIIVYAIVHMRKLKYFPELFHVEVFRVCKFELDLNELNRD